jgi:adenine-specific DNA-methyltransferase
MQSILRTEIEPVRQLLADQTDQGHKAAYGQFFTPAPVAQFMASLFTDAPNSDCRLLDPGAGIGSLAAAFLERWQKGALNFQRVSVDAFEIDTNLHPHLNKTFERFGSSETLSYQIRGEDFIRAASDWVSGSLFAKPLPQYSHAILNPPYKKIRSDSAHRSALSRAGIETVNLYTAFLALALALLEKGGQLVAIVPRSFCNGPYYRPFREFILQRAAIHRIHLFGSRVDAFHDDDVLQENIILHMERGGAQGDVTISTSSDASFADLQSQAYSFERIVHPRDPDAVLHIPTSQRDGLLERMAHRLHRLDDLQIQVSTGPVVDFRLREHLRDEPEDGSVPLLYPGHFSEGRLEWPRVGFKKPNGILLNSETEKWLYPVGNYCVVRRFSSKEEMRRIHASVVKQQNLESFRMIGFENHLNVFHWHKAGLPLVLVYGLAAFLNTSAVDRFFRRFNGHTQVNVSDLKRLYYPSRDQLLDLGRWAMVQPTFIQSDFDSKLETLLT